jgi:hypothetical protein
MLDNIYSDGGDATLSVDAGSMENGSFAIILNNKNLVNINILPDLLKQ